MNILHTASLYFLRNARKEQREVLIYRGCLEVLCHLGSKPWSGTLRVMVRAVGLQAMVRQTEGIYSVRSMLKGKL